jgi:hypothetical protein
VGEQVALLVHGAALDRHVVPQAGERRFEPLAAVDNHQLRLGEATRHQIVEGGAPGGFSLAAHVLDREHHLLPVTADAERDQQGNGRGLAIETHPHDRAVEDQADDVLAGEITLLPSHPGRARSVPGAADDVLADVALEQLGQCPADAARVHPGEIGLGDQGFGAVAEPLVGRQQRAVPFPLARLVSQPGPGHRERQRTEGGDQLAWPVPVATTVRARAAFVASPPQRRFQLLLQQLLDEPAHLATHRLLQGIEPSAVGKR